MQKTFRTNFSHLFFFSCFLFLFPLSSLLFIHPLWKKQVLCSFNSHPFSNNKKKSHFSFMRTLSVIVLTWKPFFISHQLEKRKELWKNPFFFMQFCHCLLASQNMELRWLDVLFERDDYCGGNHFCVRGERIFSIVKNVKILWFCLWKKKSSSLPICEYWIESERFLGTKAHDWFLFFFFSFFYCEINLIFIFLFFS